MSPDNAGALLEVSHLHVRFDTPQGSVKAVNGVSFSVNRGEVLGIAGESGSGKSVTALSLMRLVPQPGLITKGAVSFESQDLLKLTEKQMRRIRGSKIAMVFQDAMGSLNPGLKIGRQIGEALELHRGMDRSSARRRAVELLDLCGIATARSRLDDYPHQFSGGMRQRVMIGMALSCDPKLLIADEPTTALDVTIQAQILELLQRLSAELGMAVIMISHDLGVLARFADRVSVMYAGFVVETGTVDQVFNDPRHPYTLGLLRSIPHLEAPVRSKLIPIEGAPPDLMKLPSGCPFRPRCPYAVERSNLENPPLKPLGDGHEVACWVDVTTPSSIRGSADARTKV